MSVPEISLVGEMTKLQKSVLIKYIDEIERSGARGIVLMHDSTADDEGIMLKNNTFEMTKILIPKLKQNHYSFARLDSIDLNCDLAP
jgi:peptidoglycan/xylan/chitin deacetylase (PgdA/CDA1 family)